MTKPEFGSIASISPGSFKVPILALFLAVITVSGLPHQLQAETPIIDSIEIIAENVFDLTDAKKGNFLYQLANRIHVVTRRSVIERELLLGKGDPYDSALVNESERNLRSLPYLLKTDIYMKKGSNGDDILVVNTSDRWTTTGGMSIHRSAGRSDYQFGLEENNLLGYGLFMSHDFFVLQDDRNFYQMEIKTPRFLGKKVLANLLYSDDPRASRSVFILGRPFYNLSQRLAAQIGYSRTKQRDDYYFDGLLSARDRHKRNSVNLTGIYRDGLPELKYYLTLSYAYGDSRFRDRRYLFGSPDVIDAALPEKAVDSIVHYFQSSVRLQEIDYTQYMRLNRFLKPVDVNLGWDVQFTYGRGILTGGGQYHFLAMTPRFTHGFNSGLIILGLSEEAWYSEGRRIRSVRNGSFKGYWRYHNNHTLVLGTRYRRDWRGEATLTMYLDEDRGLRGYPVYYAGGDQRIIINLENRFFSDLEILSVGLGGAVFADIGNIWSRDHDFSLRDTRTAFGCGLRFGTSRSSQAEVVRIDLAWSPRLDTWQISFGTGQYF